MNLVPLATVILDPPTALLFGCAIALISAGLIARDPEREILRTALWGGGWALFYGLCVGWFFFQRADWMLVYLKDAQTVPLVGAYVVFLLVLVAHGAVGALANAALLRRGKRGMAWLVMLGAILTLGGAFWLQAKQYFLVGSYAQYYANVAIPLPQDSTMQVAMNVSGALSAGSAIALFVMRYLKTRRAIAAEAQGAYRAP